MENNSKYEIMELNQLTAYCMQYFSLYMMNEIENN